MSKLTDEQLGQFTAQMEAEGWHGSADLFGNVTEWQHKKTHKIVRNDEAERYWLFSGQCPVPF